MAKEPFLTCPVPWVGGKVRMRHNITPYFERCDYKLYVEPFGGVGGMFYGKPHGIDEMEVYNDRNGLLVNFFKQIRDAESVQTIKQLCELTPHSRLIWRQLRDICFAYNDGNIARLADAIKANNLQNYNIETVVAFAFFYCQQNGFGGIFLSSYGGGVSPTPFTRKKYDNGTKKYWNKVDSLEQYGERFKYIVIECVDFAEIFKKYDSEDTLFYCDPPYETKGDTSVVYKQGWTAKNADELILLCAEAKGSVVLSCYDTRSYNVLLDAGFKRQTFRASMSVKRDSSKEDNERTETIYYKIREKSPEELEALGYEIKKKRPRKKKEEQDVQPENESNGTSENMGVCSAESV